MSSTQEIRALMKNRHCKRSFLPQSVSRDILAEILTAASHAPSSKNTQPWQVSVVLEQKVKDFSDMLCQLFDKDSPQKHDYNYTPEPWPEGFLDRARACGFGLFDLKGIGRKDYDKRKAHNRENFTFFGAPAYMVFHLPLGSEAGQFLDLGFFMQNIMLALSAYGLGSCPQFSVAGYPDAIRDFLGLENRLIVSGLVNSVKQ